MGTAAVDAETADDVACQIRGDERTTDVFAHTKPRVEDFHRELLGNGVGHPQRAHDATVMRDVRGADARAGPGDIQHEVVGAGGVGDRLQAGGRDRPCG